MLTEEEGALILVSGGGGGGRVLLTGGGVVQPMKDVRVGFTTGPKGLFLSEAIGSSMLMIGGSS